MQQAIEKRKESQKVPAIVPDPDFVLPPGAKVSRAKEVKDLKKLMRRYMAISPPNEYKDAKNPEDAYSIKNHYVNHPKNTQHFSSKQK